MSAFLAFRVSVFPGATIASSMQASQFVFLHRPRPQWSRHAFAGRADNFRR